MFKPSQEPTLNTSNEEEITFPEGYVVAIELLNENQEISDTVKIAILKLLKREVEKDYTFLKSRNQDLSNFKNREITVPLDVLGYVQRYLPKVAKRLAIEKMITWSQKNSIFDEQQRETALNQQRKEVDILNLTSEEKALFEWLLAIIPPRFLKSSGII